MKASVVKTEALYTKVVLVMPETQTRLTCDREWKCVREENGGVEVGTRSRVDENGLSCKCVNVEVYNKAGGTLMTI